MTRNIIEGIQDECNRCRELITQYAQIGPTGTFGRMMIEQAIKEGEAAIASGDVVRCISAFNNLQGCE